MVVNNVCCVNDFIEWGLADLRLGVNGIGVRSNRTWRQGLWCLKPCLRSCILSLDPGADLVGHDRGIVEMHRVVSGNDPLGR